MTRRLPILLAGAGCATIAALAAVPATAGSNAATPGFGVPRVVDPIHAYGEPDIAVNPKTGAIHTSGPQGTGSQRSVWNVSVDGGDSYRIIQNVPVAAYQSQLTPTKSLVAPGGGDTDIAIAHNGQVFFNDLYTLTCFAAGTTTDDGKTTAFGTGVQETACSKFGADRQWFALYDPQPSDRTVSPYKGKTPVAYMEYQEQGTTADEVSMSTDGTNYLTSAGTYANDGTHRPNHTPPIVDQHTGDLLGLTSGTGSNSLALAVGKPDSAAKLTFNYVPVASGLKGNPQTLFPVLTEDTARNLYAIWVDSTTYQVWYSWAPATDGWKHWAAPRQVNVPPARTNVLPWAAAGRNGIVDIAWYGTDRSMAQLKSSDPLKSDGPSASNGQTWNLFFSQLTAANSSHPKPHQVVAAQHPMHYNDICMDGTACAASGGNRNQADFFKLVLAQDGRARIIYTDESNGLSEVNNSDSAADHAGAALDTVVTQETGLNAYTGKPLKARETRAPQASIVDPTGDALFKPLGGTDVPSADLRSVVLKRTGSNLVITATTRSGSIGDAALAARTGFAELVFRWQMGNTLYHAGVFQSAAGGPLTAYAGKTSTVDLCSVSLCKPNYLQYGAPPLPNTSSAAVTANVSQQRTTYTITVPLSAIGNPGSNSLLEEVMGFVTVSQAAPSAQMDQGSAFADEVPVQIEGTRTFNFRASGSARGPVRGELLPLIGLLPLAALLGRGRTQRGATRR